RELVGGDGQSLLDLAVAQNLHGAVLARQPRGHQDFGIDGVAGVERGEVPQVHNVVLDAEDVGEAALGQPPVERHLAALEAALVPVAGAGLLALVAASGGLAVAGAGTAADTLAIVRGAGRRSEVVESRRRRARRDRGRPLR